MQYRPRRPLLTILLSLVLLVLTVAGPLASASAATFAVTFRSVASGFQAPTQVTSARDGSGRLFVVEQRGTIQAIARNGAGARTTFMSITDLVEDGGERGLLGLAFHPHFATNRTLFVYYTRNGGDIVLARYQTNVARTAVVNSTGRVLLVIEHSAYSNHNGGSLAFGPDDGYLYIGTGDGGGAGDPDNNAQNKNSLLGKLLRIDVDGTGSGPLGRYRIPSTNPFIGAIPGRSEIWAYGLRNPWRISFDRGSRRLFVADVGQNRYEEVDRQNRFGSGGKNYGWDRMEGKHCYQNCPLAGDTLPIIEYSHADGNCSITGGFVYRGPTQTKLLGQYVYADFCSGRIWTVPWDGVTPTQRRDTSLMITSFGESDAGEVYVVTTGGLLFQVIAS